MKVTKLKKGDRLIVDPEFESLIPPLSEEEFKQLRDEIIDWGECRDPLIVWNENTKAPGDLIILDGHNRWRVIQEFIETDAPISFEYRCEIFHSREDAKAFMIRNQLGRRNLPNYERARLALQLKPLLAEEAKAKQAATLKQNSTVNQKSDEREINTNKELAKAAGVSHDTIHKVDVIEQKAAPEIKEQLRKGEVSINKVYNFIRRQEPERARPKLTIIRDDSSPYKPEEYSWRNPKADKAEFDKKLKSIAADMETTDKPYGLDDAICELNGAEDVFFTQIRFILEERKEVIAADERGHEQIAAFIQSVHRNLDAVNADV